MEWTTQKLGDFCEVIAGQSPEGKYYNDTGDGLPFYQGKKEFQKTNIGPPQKWTTKVTKEAKAGDILMSVRAPVGPINFSTQSICIGRGLAAIRPSEEIDRSFLFYYLLSKQDEIKGSEGAVFASINKSQIESLQFPYVNIDEQKRIVAILDQVFADIEKASVTAETNLKNARELFDSYLQQVFSRGDDEKVKLGDEIELLTGFAFKSKEYVTHEKSIPLIRGDNIVQGQLRWDGVKLWPTERLVEFEKYELAANDIVLAMDRTWVKAGIKVAKIANEDLPALLVQRVARLRCKSSLHPDFLYYLIRSKFFENYVLSIQTGLGVPHISGKQIQLFTFNKPSYDQQLELIKKMNALSCEVQSLEAVYRCKINSLDELKKSILQQAFSGELTKSKGIAA